MNEKGDKLARLVLWYRHFLADAKAAAFASRVASRYTMSTLHRLTVASNCETRRAAVLALGMLGAGESIAVVGRCLRDNDRCVRLVAEVAFSDLTHRQMGVRVGQRLAVAKRHIDGQRYDQARLLLDELLQAWPEFGEAWYQRAVTHYCLGNYALAIKSARQAVGCNRHHFAAWALRARCCLELDKSQAALRYFRKSFAINPSQLLVRNYIDVLSRSRRLNLDDPAA